MAAALRVCALRHCFPRVLFPLSQIPTFYILHLIKLEFDLAIAKSGDTVHVHYTGSLSDGTVFDSSRERDPLSFTVGAGQVIPGFNNAVEGMNVGDSATVNIPAAEAYGEFREDFVIQVNPSDIPPEITPEVGMDLQLHQQDGGAIPVKITAVTEEKITLDANHPLAGKDLTFEIELMEIAAEDA
jgi:peptidylprolyl isomerase